jgi:hypothetical protein
MDRTSGSILQESEPCALSKSKLQFIKDTAREWLDGDQLLRVDGAYS